ncbi:hypothetical protein AGABI2DRAFT_212068 [Agaricus bisporus var. bisporus H97]|uniref:hypothetical protein n=1 Tax=Agaricus bisporus var. bisporus (strain H97 / ATCC MYA-4626 / FGSC 10389) TaxID=936046 RepID=UPI00029F7961|nr:hypothetical protein AGABI2DRAFT_212068 [Agaricus bisporus var. bisporus H97]EKV42549.1 hypothetical protein AGABI2DRAFT_212068 [Agaricus bisporus var. bisporus H97]
MPSKDIPESQNRRRAHTKAGSPASSSVFTKSRNTRFLVESTNRITQLKPESKECIYRLASYTAPKLTVQVPKSRRAAVLVALFIGRSGDLYVLLNRRSPTLRTYAGDTSLPGGKVELTDRNLEDTARREAFEEIGLPRDRRKVPLLCILEPFLAAELVVTPVVVLILDNTLRPIINTDEVASLFSHPLASFLSTTSPFHATEPETIEVDYHTSFTVESSAPHGRKYFYMVHQFLTGREAGGIKPIFGLTASMMVRVAVIGYGRFPDFQMTTPESAPLDEKIAWALLNRPVLRHACMKEGLDMRLPLRICNVTRQEFEAMVKAQESTQEVKDGKKRHSMHSSGRNWMRAWKTKL